MKAKDLYELAESTFGKRTSLLMLLQEIAENFYPERADFTYRRYLGMDFAANLMSSFPVLCRRDFSDQIGQMLRPTAKEWFHIKPLQITKENNRTKRWLEWAGATMRRAMYDRKSLFTTMSKQADADYAAFGNAVTSVRLNRTRDRLLCKCWHLRDCAWIEDENGQIVGVFRKFKPTARDLVRTFGDKVHQSVKDAMGANHPLEEYECMHMVVAADLYDDEPAKGRPYWSIYYDCSHQEAIETTPQWSREYNIARWMTVSGNPYGYSPAVVAALPDARLIQAMTWTLLEAGEKVTNPPMIATMDAVRSDVGIYAGALTWVDRDYDERMGEALRPMTIDANGMPIGRDMLMDARSMISAAFYLNKLKPFLPTQDKEMTAFQAGQIVAQYIRDALPLFEPMEEERNGAECELIFDLMLRNGGFGSFDDMPPELRGPSLAELAEIQFGFVSPLHDALGAQKGAKFLEAKQLISAAMELDQGAASLMDPIESLRDALDGIGAPAKWVRDEVSVDQIRQTQQNSVAIQRQLQAANVGADTAAKLSTARRNNVEAATAA